MIVMIPKYTNINGNPYISIFISLMVYTDRSIILILLLTFNDDTTTTNGNPSSTLMILTTLLTLIPSIRLSLLSL